MDDLFTTHTRPLAERMRPRRLSEVIGHDAIAGPKGILQRLIARNELPSIIFWGPPGCGKTTLARLLARDIDAHFEQLSAVLGGVRDIREIVARAKGRRARQATLLFVDEIHRFNKAQQDALLPHVEDGTLTLIGATTENPSFALNSALLSRCRVLRLESLGPEALAEIIDRALDDEARGLGLLGIDLTDDARQFLALKADGDARRALGELEVIAQLAAQGTKIIDLALLEETLGKIPLRHDRDGDQHYDLTSAFIKSMRGSDPDAALYYLARLIEGGDDPRFLLRRMIIFASEDIGNADPRALSVALDGLRAYEVLGMPEGRIPMGQVCTYLATAPKSNASYLAINQALQWAQLGSKPVPMKIRNAPTQLMKSMGHGEGYLYPHDHGGYVPEHYLPEDLQGQILYDPPGHGYEQHIAERLKRWREQRDK